MIPGSDGHFDKKRAAIYDDDTEVFDPAVVDPIVDLLEKLCPDGRALEFGIGTGRIALPLARRGIAVHGVDISNAMIERLKEKQRDEDISITLGDFSTTRVDSSFSLVYLIFNTIMNLTTQASQVACFRNASAHLKAGGRFVIEVMVPQIQRLAGNETLHVFDHSETHWGIDEYDVVSQMVVSHHAQIVDSRAEIHSTPFRYVWPGELDLMAELAGLSFSERFGGWDRGLFTGASRSHVSIWSKPRC